MMPSMFGLPPSLSSDFTTSDAPADLPSATELAREVAACHKRSNILLALTQQDLAQAREWLERSMAEESRNGERPSIRK
jgi:hypothetical protein